MKQLFLLSILLSSFVFIANAQSIDTSSTELELETFFDRLKALLEAESETSYSPVLLFDEENSMELPGFGMNSQITYPSNVSSSTHPLNTIADDKFIQSMLEIDPSHLRFPGGQLSNSFFPYTTYATWDGTNYTEQYEIDWNEFQSNTPTTDGALDQYIFDESG